MPRCCHNQRLWRFGDPLTPKILDTALERFQIAKANHQAQWEAGGPRSFPYVRQDDYKRVFLKLREILDTALERFKIAKANHQTQWEDIPGGPRSSPHARQDDYKPGFRLLPRELRLMIWEEATVQYFGKHKRILQDVPQNDQWKRVGHLFTGCPIKNICMESRVAYNKMLKAFPPVYGFTVPERNVQKTFDQWAPTDGSMSELFIQDYAWHFLKSMKDWNEGAMCRIQTIYLEPEGFFGINQSPKERSLPKTSTYYQARSRGASLSFQRTQISPSATDLYGDVLFSLTDAPFLGDRGVPEERHRMWIRCAQMQRKQNGDLVVVYSIDMPWDIDYLQLRFLFVRLGPCFRRLPNLERIAFIQSIKGMPQSCQPRCCCITFRTSVTRGALN